MPRPNRWVLLLAVLALAAALIGLLADGPDAHGYTPVPASPPQVAR